MFIFLSPVSNAEVSQTVLDSVQKAIEDSANVNYDYISVILNDSISECFSIDLEMTDVIVKDEEGEFINGNSDGENVYIQGTEGKFYIIYSSPAFIENPTQGECSELEIGNYTFGLLRKNKAISWNSIIDLKQNYSSDYENLKKQLNIPSSNDFGFYIWETDGTRILEAMKEQPVKISIIAKDVPLQLLYEDGTIKYVIMNIRAW